MKIRKLGKTRENLRLYSILSFVCLSILIIILSVFAVIYKDERRNIFIRAIFIALVFDIVALEVMLEALTIRLYEYKMNDNSYIIYAGIFNTYLFINEKEVLNKYDINCFNRCRINYLNKDELIEIEISSLINKIEFKIDGEVVGRA